MVVGTGSLNMGTEANDINTKSHSRYGNGTGHSREYCIVELLLKVVGQQCPQYGGDAID